MFALARMERLALAMAMASCVFLASTALGSDAPKGPEPPQDPRALLEAVHQRLDDLGADFADRLTGFDAKEIRARRALLHHLHRQLRSLDPDLDGLRDLRRRFGDYERALVNRETPVERPRHRPDVPEGAGGGIAGIVTDQVTGLPIEGVYITARDTTGYFHGGVETGPGGRFLLGGLGPDSYSVHASPSTNHIGEYYDDVPCPDGPYGSVCDDTSATPVVVVENVVTSSIDFVLDRGGAIQGQVTDGVTGNGLGSADVQIWNTDGDLVGDAYADYSTGSFTIERLLAGSYFAVAYAYSRYETELFDDIPCGNGAHVGCEPTDGTPIVVTTGQTTSNVDFALDPLAEISGHLTDADLGGPIRFQTVRVFDDAGNLETSTISNYDGSYSADGVPAGTKFVATQASDYQDEVWDDIACPNSRCDPTTGTPIPVAIGDQIGRIDFALEPLGGITGQVRDAATGSPLLGVSVYATGPDLSSRSAETDLQGFYRIQGLAPADYFVYTVNHSGFLDQLHEGHLCEDDPYGGCDLTLGTPVVVTLGVYTSSIDFDLQVAGSVAGHVTRAPLGGPLQAHIALHREDGSVAATVDTDVLGHYRLLGVPPGTYFAVASRYQWQSQIFDGVTCGDYCDAASGTPILIGPSEQVTGIDFFLTPAPIFADGFESGATFSWSQVVGLH